MYEYAENVRDGLKVFYGSGRPDHVTDVRITGSLCIIFLSLAILFYNILTTVDHSDTTSYTVAAAAGISSLGTIFWTLLSPLPEMRVLLGLTDTGVFTIVGVVVTVLAAAGYAHFEDTDEEVEETITITPPRPRTQRYQTFAAEAPAAR